MIYSVLDFETTGLGASKSRVVEIGIVKMDSAGKKLDSFETLVNPDGQSVGATHIHGISQEMVAEAPTFSEIAPDLLAFMNGTVVTAHNARFDIPFLDQELRRSGIKRDENPIPSLCTLILSRRFMRDLPSHSLENLTAILGITNSLVHSAAADAEAAGALLTHLLTCHKAEEFIPMEPLVFRGFTASFPPSGSRWTRNDYQRGGQLDLF